MLVHNLPFYSVVFASPKMLFVEITICRATIQQPDHRYRLNYTVTATQKEILKAFGINEVNIKKWANEISAKLSDEMKEAV